MAKDEGAGVPGRRTEEKVIADGKKVPVRAPQVRGKFNRDHVRVREFSLQPVVSIRR